MKKLIVLIVAAVALGGSYVALDFNSDKLKSDVESGAEQAMETVKDKIKG